MQLAAIDRRISALEGQALELFAIVRSFAYRSCPSLFGSAMQGGLLAYHLEMVMEQPSLTADSMPFQPLQLEVSLPQHDAQAVVENNHLLVPCTWVSKTRVLLVEKVALHCRYCLEAY
jgi:hypothetical protein